MREEFKEWWNEQTLIGDPSRRPNLTREAYEAAWQHQQKEIDRLAAANKSLNAEETKLDVLMPRTDWENDMREARLALVKLAPKDRDAIIRLISTPDHIPDAEPCPNCDSLVEEAAKLRDFIEGLIAEHERHQAEGLLIVWGQESLATLKHVLSKFSTPPIYWTKGGTK